MIYEVSEHKKDFVVDLKEVGEGVYELILDGVTTRIDVVKSGRTIFSLIESDSGRQWEAMVDERGSHGFDVLVAGRLFHLDAVDQRRKLLSQTSSLAAEGKQVLEAPMPGKIVKVGVAVGDDVREGQGLLIVEAMKMENEIGSPIDGRVTEIGVRVGETVDAGAMLIVVEPIETT